MRLAVSSPAMDVVSVSSIKGMLPPLCCFWGCEDTLPNFHLHHTHFCAKAYLQTPPVRWKSFVVSSRVPENICISPSTSALFFGFGWSPGCIQNKGAARCLGYVFPSSRSSMQATFEKKNSPTPILEGWAQKGGVTRIMLCWDLGRFGEGNEDEGNSRQRIYGSAKCTGFPQRLRGTLQNQK